MAKPVLQLAAIGVVGVILWKLFFGVFLKLVFLVALAFLAVWVFKRWSEKNEKKGDAPAE